MRLDEGKLFGGTEGDGNGMKAMNTGWFSGIPAKTRSKIPVPSCASSFAGLLGPKESIALIVGGRAEDHFLTRLILALDGEQRKSAIALARWDAKVSLEPNSHRQQSLDLDASKKKCRAVEYVVRLMYHRSSAALTYCVENSCTCSATSDHVRYCFR